MAKLTAEYVEEKFFENFAKLPEPEQRGIIAGLEAVRKCVRAKPPKLEPLFEEEKDGNADNRS